MFTGLVQALGTVLGAESAARPRGAGGLSHRLTIDLGALGEGLAAGASVAVNGVCLTAVEQHGTTVGFDVVPETWGRSTLQHLRRGERVHLERSLRVGDALDGHFVQGHVDGIGRVARVERGAGEWKLWVSADAEVLRYIVAKGSVALDGTSLTVVDVEGGAFSVALIPTTLAVTRFAGLKAGDPLNIETDILARLVLARLEALVGAGKVGGVARGITWEQLQAGGFAS